MICCAASSPTPFTPANPNLMRPAEAEAAGRADRIPVMVSANFNPDDPVHMLKRTVEQFGDAGAGWITVNVPSNSVDEACRSLELLADELGACVVSS